MNKDMGIMTATIITVALIFDFLFLPALLIQLHGKRKSESTNQENLTPASANI